MFDKYGTNMFVSPNRSRKVVVGGRRTVRTLGTQEGLFAALKKGLFEMELT
jgi:hypothetical protein